MPHSKARLTKTGYLFDRKLALDLKKESMPSHGALAPKKEEQSRGSTGSGVSHTEAEQEKTTPRKRPGYWTDYERGPRPPGCWVEYGARRRNEEAQSATKIARVVAQDSKAGLKLRRR